MTYQEWLGSIVRALGKEREKPIGWHGIKSLKVKLVARISRLPIV
jgi:hypothetical protein